jgi:hypothetical protein
LGYKKDVFHFLHGDKYSTVVPNKENVEKTIQSYDGAVFGDYKTQFYIYGLKYLGYKYGHIFKDCICTEEELSSYIDWTKSPGYTASVYGLQTKGDLIADQGFLASDHNLNPEKTIPLVSVANKVEPKLVVDINMGKIRHFFISEFHHFREQIRFGKRASNRLKGLHWSSYGFSPFFGGVHRLAIDILQKPLRFFYDVSGWDKFLPILGDVYEVITYNMTIPESLIERYKWMVLNTVQFVCVLWDGDVVLKTYGNASGSGTTTRDNILAHIVIAVSLLSEAYYMKFEKLPNFRLLTEQVIRLFGDDSIYSIDECFDHVLTEGFIQGFFQKFGLKLKFFFGGIDYDIEKIQFLGFYFKKYKGFYIPKYDVSRLSLSMLHVNEKSDNLVAYVSKVFTLTIMSFGTDHFNDFLQAFECLQQTLQHETRPELETFKTIKLTHSLIENFYIGTESSTWEFCFFDSHWRRWYKTTSLDDE